jgi:YqjK-like protein
VAKTLAELHEEQGRLRERIARQRAELAVHAAPLRNALASGDRAVHAGRNAFDTVSRHPFGLAALAAVVLAFKPRVVWRWGMRGLLAWRSARALSGWLPEAIARFFRK